MHSSMYPVKTVKHHGQWDDKPEKGREPSYFSRNRSEKDMRLLRVVLG